MKILKMFSSNNKTKDLFETSALIHIIVKHLCKKKIDKHDDIIFIILGDGKYPKCGYLLADFFKLNEIISIDPICINNKEEYPSNLKIISDYDYNIDMDKLIGNKRPFFISKHGHGDFVKHFLKYENSLGITMPCCCLSKQLLTEKTERKDKHNKYIHLFNRINHKYLIEKGKFDILTDSPGNCSNCFFLYSKKTHSTF